MERGRGLSGVPVLVVPRTFGDRDRGFLARRSFSITIGESIVGGRTVMIDFDSKCILTIAILLIVMIIFIGRAI